VATNVDVYCVEAELVVGVLEAEVVFRAAVLRLGSMKVVDGGFREVDEGLTIISLGNMAPGVVKAVKS
jgi:hypothetical protein